MKRDQFNTETITKELCDTINAVWTALGHSANAYPVLRKQRWVIESELVNGLPRKAWKAKYPINTWTKLEKPQ